MPATSLMLTAVLAAGSVTWSTANSVSTGDQNAPAVAANRTGGVAVAWVDDRNPADPHSEIFLRFYQDGTPVYEVKVSPGGSGAWRHVAPDVGLDDRGNAVVVWADDPDGNGYRNVPYRIFSRSGRVLAAGRANADATGDQIAPRVAVDPDGTPADPSAVAFTVAWQDVQATTVTVRAAGYTDLTTKAYEKRASQAAGTHRTPDVAVSAAGDATVVWAEDADGNNSENVGLTRLARSTGAVLLSARTANVHQTGRQSRPAVAANANGDLAVAWESVHTGTAGVWARSFTPSGTARHDEVPASVAAGAAAPSVGVDDQGGVVVGWTDAGADGMLRGLNPDGTATGRLPVQVLAWRPQGRQDQFAVAVSPWSEVAVAYTDDSDGNGSDQILLGIGATNDDGSWPAAPATDTPV